MAKLTLPSVFSFERKLSNSDARMHSCSWEDKCLAKTIEVREKTVRGTISNHQKGSEGADPAKLNKVLENPNPQRVDYAALPFEHDTLTISFTLRVLGNLAPSACNAPEYREALMAKVNEYTEASQFETLAYLYAENIANGRFLWRNRVGAEAIEVQVKAGSKRWTFDAQSFALRKPGQQMDQIAELAKLIQQGLANDETAFMDVTAFVKLGQGQEVFPSQEMLLDSDKQKSKTLYSLNGNGSEERAAAMHSQKIGNALRTVDIWHPEFEKVGPIAIEPYGAVTTMGEAYRKKENFYSLLENWVVKDKPVSFEEQHYIVAVLLRGGVFSRAS